MSFAICLQVPNHIHFKKPLNIYAEFIPQILFMWSIFGYLVVCIIYKWAVDWSQSATSPPGLLNMLIYMFLSPGTIEPGTQLYAGQGFVQTALLLIALVCVPWMLCLKPYVLWKEHQKIVGQGYGQIGGQEDHQDEGDGRQPEEEDEVGNSVAPNEGGEEHVSGLHFALGTSLTRRALRWETSSYTRSFIPSSSAWAASRIREPRSAWEHQCECQLILQCVVPSTVGALPRARSAVGGALRNDHQQRLHLLGRLYRSDYYDLPNVWHVVCLDHCDSMCHGGSECFLARAPIALVSAPHERIVTSALIGQG